MQITVKQKFKKFLEKVRGKKTWNNIKEKLEENLNSDSNLFEMVKVGIQILKEKKNSAQQIKYNFEVIGLFNNFNFFS